MSDLEKHLGEQRAGRANASDVMSGVNVSFLMQVFGMDRQDINRRLKDCPVVKGVRRKDTSRNLYDLSTAAQYLVKPIFDPAEYLKTMRPSELPSGLQDSFWSAMNKKQKWEENAQHLWRTEDVMQVFGEVFQLIKGTMQLWAENMQRSTGMSAVQKTFLRAQVDGLQKELHEKLVELPRSKLPQTAELPMLLGQTTEEIETGADNDDLI